MAQDTTAGFKFMYRLSGAEPTVQTFKFKDTETLTKGDMLNVETGEVDLAATNDTAFVGIALETKAGVDSTTEIEVIVDDDAVYAVYDANIRLIGATLDISGATGAQTVAASSNADFMVVANSTAAEWTLVRIKAANHVTHL
jgi:hypothetical protein